MSRSKFIATGVPPFDSDRLDGLMERSGIDIIIATSKHNTRDLLGGYSYFFFAGFDAIGNSRYLPVVVYFRGRPDLTYYVGNAMEEHERQLGKIWTPNVKLSAWNSIDAMEAATSYIDSAAASGAVIGIESSFIPKDAADLIGKRLTGYDVRDGQRTLELLRAIKSPEELSLLRTASDLVVESILSAMASAVCGATKNEICHLLKDEEERRGLLYEYCLMSAGSSLNRSPSEYRLREGDIFSLDSGGNYKGYIGDLCRMAIIGDPDAELEDILGEVLEIQSVARKAVAVGRLGGEIYEAASQAIDRSRFRDEIDFIAHGMGLTSHESPRLASNFSYHPDDAASELGPGMVLSIETAIKNPKRGFVKIEDTIAISHEGVVEAYGDSGRSWTRAAVRAQVQQ
jgi:Xaa-Pro aminopeptidase